MISIQYLMTGNRVNFRPLKSNHNLDHYFNLHMIENVNLGPIVMKLSSIEYGISILQHDRLLFLGNIVAVRYKRDKLRKVKLAGTFIIHILLPQAL